MSGHLTDVVTFAVLALVGFRLANGLRHSMSADGRSLWRVIVGKIGWRHVWPVPFVLAAVVLVASALIRVPGLGWGWWTAFGGQGNPVFGTNDSTAGTVWEWLVPLVFITMLVPALPLFAYAEERMFRKGAESWSWRRRAVKVVQFGLAHALIGIPIGTALALSIGGSYFMAVYLRHYRLEPDAELAALESTRAHTAYNGTIVVVVLLVVLLDALR